MDAGRLATLALLGLLTADAPVQRDIRPDFYADLTWRCLGPFDGGPVASVTGTPGQAGVYVVTTPSGGAWKTTDGGDTWTSIDPRSAASASSDPHRWIDPANPRRIARTDAQGIAVSLDAGTSWVASHNLPIAEVAHLTPRTVPVETITPPRAIAGKPVTVSVADPASPGLLFAGTDEAVYVSFDDGARWASLRLNLPSVAINDLDIRGNTLVAATQGRSAWALDDLSLLRQLRTANVSAAAILFRPAEAARMKPDSADKSSPAGVTLDYYLGPMSHGDVTLTILDPGGRVVHTATSAAPAPDRWLPVMRPLPTSPGHHRVVWNLRLDPPPAQQHRYAHFARTLFEEMPPDPNGPLVLPGRYQVRLRVAGQLYVQPLAVSGVGETPASLAAERRQFDLAMRIYGAMQLAHRAFVQLAGTRADLRPLLTSADPQVARSAADLDARLAALDGSDWTGLVIPDADDEAGEVDEKEGKHPDFVPPKPVSISKDYDDPTSILGRLFANVDHAPALATVSAALGVMLTKTIRAAGVPDAAAIADYERSCQQLSGVLDAWRAMNVQDIPRANVELARRKLPPLPIATRVSTLGCGAK